MFKQVVDEVLLLISVARGFFFFLQLLFIVSTPKDFIIFNPSMTWFHTQRNKHVAFVRCQMVFTFKLKNFMPTQADFQKCCTVHSLTFGEDITLKLVKVV